jgi:hypothetical protein
MDTLHKTKITTHLRCVGPLTQGSYTKAYNKHIGPPIIATKDKVCLHLYFPMSIIRLVRWHNNQRGGCMNGRTLSTTKCWWSRGVWLLRGPIRLEQSTMHNWCVSKVLRCYQRSSTIWHKHNIGGMHPVGMIFDGGSTVNYETCICIFDVVCELSNNVM